MNANLSAEGAATPPWHALPAEEVLGKLQATVQGLDEHEAAARLVRYGPNELREANPINPWAILAAQFKSLIVWVLLAASLVSGVFGEWIDSAAILGIVILNAVIGFYQEFHAEKSIAALKRMTAPHARVRRGGKVLEIPARDIVPGDILVLDAGDLAPADGRLLQASSLKCLEAALTGESEAVTKSAGTLERAEVPLGDRENMVFMGTSVAVGSAEAVVAATGMQTEMGHIAELIQKAGLEEGTPLQKRLQSFGKLLVWICLGVVGLVFALGFLRGVPWFELFLTSVSLAVAAVPEGLPAVVTIALAVGVQRMARRRALIRKLSAVETLGSASVICTDKTGTLTVGEMTVRAVHAGGAEWAVTGEGYGPAGEILRGEPSGSTGHSGELLELLTIFAGCNAAHLVQEEGRWKVAGDPTEGALLALAGKAKVTPANVDERLPRVSEHPFDSDRKMMSVVRRHGTGALRVLVKGAPDILLAHCEKVLTPEGVRPLTEEDRQRIAGVNTDWTGRALRVLGGAYRDGGPELEAAEASLAERDLIFVGLAGLYDPPRPEAREAIGHCRSAGIRVVMITGDHPGTALAVARELGLAAGTGLALSGTELDSLPDEELKARVPEAAIFARVTAEHKLRIIRAWQANGAVVAMTGDGVNDAPAIKGADIGIAMGKSGTEVTKEASDMILTDDNFATIVAAIEEGRGVYDNIKKTLLYLLSGNTGELLLMAVCVLLGLPLPLLPIHLLWINLVTDGLPALCLATDPIDPDVMKCAPRPSGEGIADRGFVARVSLTGVLSAGVALAVYLYGLKYESLELARTHAFSVLVFEELLRSFSCRSETKVLWQVGAFTNLRLAVVVGMAILFQIWSHHNAVLGGFLKTGELSWMECGLLLLIGAIPVTVLEATKLVKQRWTRPPSKANAFQLHL